MTTKAKEIVCSFCGKGKKAVRKMIAGPGDIYICDTCITVAFNTISGQTHKKDVSRETTEEIAIPSPREIKEHLDKYIIGQNDAKTTMAVAVYNHYKRLQRIGDDLPDDEIEIDKSNLLLIGPTGSGKTLIAQTIARMLQVPFAIADATTLTQAGYVGDDADSIIARLLQAANYDVKKAERGIVFIDEIDKKRARGDGGASGIDVGGEGVQQSLLKILEGSDVMVAPTGSKKTSNELVKVSTKNILFILGGAFVGLDLVVSGSLAKKSGIGFTANVEKDNKTVDELLSKVEPSHLVKYGMIPELVGRVPVIATLQELTEDQLIHVLTQPKNAICKQFSKLFALDGVELEFDPESLAAIAKLSRERKTGARGLRGVLEKNLRDVQFKLPDLRRDGATRVRVTSKVITDGAAPEIIFSPTDPSETK